MAHPTAPVTVSLTLQVLGLDFTQNPATTIEREETLSYSTTVANYATDIPAFAGGVYAREVSMLAAVSHGELSSIHGQVLIDDVDYTPSTPLYYSTWEGYSTPTESVASVQAAQRQQSNFQIGPNDFTDANSLGTVITAAVTKAVTNVGY